jgi:NAD+ diphosphatase
VSRFAYCPRCGAALVDVLRDGRSRPVCPAETCGFVHWNNPTPVVAAICERSDGVILVRDKGWPATWYGLVTGFLEAGEHPEGGVLREVEEELGLQGRLVGLVGLYTFEAMNQLIVAYHVEVSGEVVLGDELEGFKVVPVERLKPWALGTGQAVKDWLASRSRATGGTSGSASTP